MQAIASFRDQDSENILAALKRLENRERGIMALPLLMPNGWFARITWPDWPRQEAESASRQVKEFQEANPKLRPVPKGSEEWTFVSRGLEADYESAKAIGDTFDRFFDGRIAWAESWRDRRGRITATCSAKGVGNFSLDLAWRSSSIQPLGSLKPEHYDAFRQASHEVMAWASNRIQPILDALKAKAMEVYGARFTGLYVYGSYARPDAGIKLPIDSDIDVALLLTDFEDGHEERSRVGDLVAKLSLDNDIVISLMPIREADYNEGRTNFTRVISEYAVPVK
jgi:uncharacterized protein